MNPDYFRTLYDYHYWTNRRVWGCITPLTEDQYRQPSAHSVGSIHEQIVHLMSAEYIWFSRLRGLSPTAMFRPEDFPGREVVRARWDEIEAMVRGYLSALTPERLASGLEYRRTGGEAYSNPVWVILTQVVNHATDHRAQIMYLINALGGQTVPQDFILYAREKGIV